MCSNGHVKFICIPTQMKGVVLYILVHLGTVAAESNNELDVWKAAGETGDLA